MGRAIVRRPSVFLMDEPLSNLDAKLRVQMRSEISRIQRELGVTTIYVTHDQVEAMTMGDRVAVMLDGRLQQLDAPQAMYARPANMFVAGFIGSPPMNLLAGRVASDVDGSVAVDIGCTHLPVGPMLASRCRTLAPGRDVVVGIRPEHLRPCRDDSSTLAGRVTAIESLGAEIIVHVDVEAQAVSIADAVVDERAREELGAELTTTGTRASVVARLDPDAAIEKSAAVCLAVDPERLHLFDRATGTSLVDA
jgi:multiple sugar transport system ATP-binding protein